LEEELNAAAEAPEPAGLGVLQAELDDLLQLDALAGGQGVAMELTLAHAAARKGKQQRREKEDDESYEDLGDNARARAPASRARVSGKVRAI
jgi:hypothetical protein